MKTIIIHKRNGRIIGSSNGSHSEDCERYAAIQTEPTNPDDVCELDNSALPTCIENCGRPAFWYIMGSYQIKCVCCRETRMHKTAEKAKAEWNRIRLQS